MSITIQSRGKKLCQTSRVHEKEKREDGLDGGIKRQEREKKRGRRRKNKKHWKVSRDGVEVALRTFDTFGISWTMYLLQRIRRRSHYFVCKCFVFLMYNLTTWLSKKKPTRYQVYNFMAF